MTGADAIMLRGLASAGLLVQSLGTIAVVLACLAAARGMRGPDAGHVAGVLVKIGLMTVILSANVYGYWVRDGILTALPTWAVNFVAPGASAAGGTAAFDLLLGQVWAAGLSVWNALPSYNGLKFVVVPLFWIAGFLAVAAGYGIWMQAHIMAVLYVATGGFFLCFAFFGATRQITAAWFGAMLSAVVLQILSVALTAIVVVAETAILDAVMRPSSLDAFARLGLLAMGGLLFGLCGWWASKLPSVAASLCGGVHFSPRTVMGLTYGAVGAGASKLAGRVTSSPPAQRARDAVMGRNQRPPASPTPPGPSLSQTPATAGAR